MAEQSKVNVKLSDTQLKKLKAAFKNKTGMILNILDGNNLPHKWLLTTRQKTKLRNVYNNNKSTDIKLSKSQMSKIIQSGGFLGSLLSRLAGPLMKVAVPLAKKILFPLGITAPASAIDAAIQNKIYRNKNIKANIFRIKGNNSIMCGYFSIGFMDLGFVFLLKLVVVSFLSESVLRFAKTSLFS